MFLAPYRLTQQSRLFIRNTVMRDKNEDDIPEELLRMRGTSLFRYVIVNTSSNFKLDDKR